VEVSVRSFSRAAQFAVLLCVIGGAGNFVWAEGAERPAMNPAVKPSQPQGAEISIARQAAQLYAEHDLARAIEVLRQGVRDHPGSAQLHFMLGNALMRSQNWSAAVPEYQKSAKLRPDHPDTYLNLGFAYYHDGKTRQAVEAWRTASSQSPNDAMIHATLGAGFLKIGDRADALSEVASAQRLDPTGNWCKIVAMDFRWNEEMRADAYKLRADEMRPAEHSQGDLAQQSGLGKAP
jgi:Flp pilus assembly protein TadD